MPPVTPAKLLLVVLAVTACSSSATQSAPHVESRVEAPNPETTEAASSSATAPALPSNGAPQARCGDHACSECGAAICPPGMFCVQYANAEPGCSWLPACTVNDRCDCITSALGPGCRCEAHGDSIRVTCDSGG